jgi:V/A-type H+-transporting ATPase subunit C
MSKLIRLQKNTYSSAKVSVKRGKLYGNEKLLKLVELEFDEILRYLEENGFRKSVDKSYLQYEGFYLIERILNDHLSQIYKSIFLGAPKQNKKLLEAYYLKYQVHNIMVVLRCKASKENDFEAYLIGDTRRKEKYLKAFEMPIEDSIIYMSKKLGFDHNEVLRLYEESIYEVENYLYKNYYIRLKKNTFKYNNVDEKYFASFVQKYIDLLNIRAYLRLRDETKLNIDFKELYLEGGKLNLEEFISLDSKNDASVIQFLKKHIGDTDLSMDNLTIQSIDKKISNHKNEAQKMLKKSRFGSPFYPLKFLLEAEKEMNFLRIILKAKYLKLNKEEILNLIK